MGKRRTTVVREIEDKSDRLTWEEAVEQFLDRRREAGNWQEESEE